MTHRGPFQPLLFCDSVILWFYELPFECMGIQRMRLRIYIKSFSYQGPCTKAAISQHIEFLTFLIFRVFALKSCFLFQWSAWKTWCNPTGWRDLQSKGYLLAKELWGASGWCWGELAFASHSNRSWLWTSKDQALLERSQGQGQSPFFSTALLPSRLRVWSTRKKSSSQSHTCASRLVLTSVPDCDIEIPCFVPWGPRYSDAPQGTCHGEKSRRRASYSGSSGLGPSLFFNPHPR